MNGPGPLRLPPEDRPRCPSCGGPPGFRGGSFCPRCDVLTWPVPTTRPRPEVEHYFQYLAGLPPLPSHRADLPRIMIEPASLRRPIGRDERRPTRLGGWLVAIRHRWSRLFPARKAGAAGGGVSDRWID